jgi:hypothetical protein
VVRASKRGRSRTVPLHAEAHDAIARWYASRPTSASDALFVSLRQRRSARPEAISASAVGDVVAKHTTGTGVREDRRTAHALRHTFCTMLAERGVALEVIRELAGHVDVRTTQIYVDVTDQRKNDGIAALARVAHPLASGRVRQFTCAEASALTSSASSRIGLKGRTIQPRTWNSSSASSSSRGLITATGMDPDAAIFCSNCSRAPMRAF